MKIGILSGTFDPVHSGHVELARTATSKLDLDRVLFVPERQSRYKTKVSDYIHRLNMLQLALVEEPKMAVFESIQVTHSIELEKEVRAEYVSCELYLLLGADSAGSIKDWHNYEKLKQTFKIVSFARSGTIAQVELNHPASSKTIRKQTSFGQKSDHLSPRVLEYINEHKLYQG